MAKSTNCTDDDEVAIREIEPFEEMTADDSETPVSGTNSAVTNEPLIRRRKDDLKATKTTTTVLLAGKTPSPEQVHYQHIDEELVGDTRGDAKGQRAISELHLTGEPETERKQTRHYHQSVRRKNSFERVRKVFETTSSSLAPARPLLSRPVSVNFPYSPFEMQSSIEMPDLQRRRSNDDLTSDLKSPLSKRLSTSSSRMSDLYIIPNKTVLENVRFFESKTAQAGHTVAAAIPSFNRLPLKGTTSEVEISTTTSNVTSSDEPTDRYRFSASADDIPFGEPLVDSAVKATEVSGSSGGSGKVSSCDERSIDDLFKHLYDRLPSKESTAVARRSAPSRSEPQRAAQLYSSSTVATQTPPSYSYDTETVNLCLHINSTATSSSKHPSSHSVKSSSLKNKCSSPRKSVTGRTTSRHRLRRSTKVNTASAAAAAASCPPVSVHLSLGDTATTCLPSSHHSPITPSPTTTEYHLRLSSTAFQQFSARLRTFCDRHSLDKDSSLEHYPNDQSESPTPPPSPPFLPNILHRDSIINSQDMFASSSSHPWKNRRKAVYKRNFSLSDYLQRNLSKPASNGGGMLAFQNDYPWKHFVQSSRHSSRLDELTNEQIVLYEAIFEIILTEKTYNSNLEKLTKFTDTYPQIKTVTSNYDRLLLFGNVAQLFAANEALFSEFEASFHLDIFMGRIFPILTQYLTSGRLEPYIEYMKGQEERNRLVSEKQVFFQSLLMAEAAKLNSLFIVPMQRITRYPLLLKNILETLTKVSAKEPSAQLPDRQAIEECYQAASAFALRCNKALEDERRMCEMILFKQSLSGGLRIDDFVTPNRYIECKCTIKVQRRVNYRPSSMHKPEAKEFKLKGTLVLLTDMLLLTEFKLKKSTYHVHDYELLDRIELRRMRTESGRFSLPSASGGFGGASPAVDLDLLDPLSLGHFIPPSPTSPQTPHSPPFILKFSQDTCSNIYLATFSQSEEEDKFLSELKRLKDAYTERLGHSESVIRRRQSGPAQMNGTTNRLSTLSNTSFYYSDGDSRSTNSSDIDYFNTV